MKKGQSWRLKQWRPVIAGNNVHFIRGVGTVVVQPVGDKVRLSPQLKGMPMPPEREAMFIEHALVMLARFAMVGPTLVQEEIWL